MQRARFSLLSTDFCVSFILFYLFYIYIYIIRREKNKVEEKILKKKKKKNCPTLKIKILNRLSDNFRKSVFIFLKTKQSKKI